jgi:hypothetical protein
MSEYIEEKKVKKSSKRTLNISTSIPESAWKEDFPLFPESGLA